jgi:hypothetical protein
MTQETTIQEQQDALLIGQSILTISAEGMTTVGDAMDYIHKKIKKELKKRPDLYITSVSHSSGYSADTGYFASSVVVLDSIV